MPWEHCAAAITDETTVCPACGATKASWTVEFEATRTFRVARRPTLRFELLTRSDAAVADEPFVVTLPGGEVVEGRTDEFGFAKVVSPTEGPCRVSFPSRRGTRLSGAPPGPDGHVTETGSAKRTFRAGGVSLRVRGASGATGADTLDWEDAGDARAEGSAPDGERVAPGRITEGASDPTADAELAAAYGARVLEAVWDIQQDQSENDCGPTCVTFLRFGGKGCSGPPRHLLRGWVSGTPDDRAEARVAGSDVQNLAAHIRRETRFRAPAHNSGDRITDHEVGLVTDEELEALNEWARVHQGRIRRFQLDTRSMRSPDEGETFQTFVRDLERRLRDRLGLNPGQRRRRGAVLFYWVTSHDLLPSTQLETRGSIFGSFHWCVVTDVRTGERPRYGRNDGGVYDTGTLVELHNPGPGCGYETWDLAELALMHQASPWPDSTLLYEEQDDLGADWYVRSGDVVCELDAGASTWGVALTATADGELLDYDAHADARAEELARAEHTTVAVVERPQGVYHVVKTDCVDLSDGLFEDANEAGDTATGSFGDAVDPEGGSFAARERVASVWVFARRVTDAGAEEFRWFGWEPERTPTTRGR